jgi:hypothetical protein
MGQFASKACVEIQYPFPVSVGFGCIPTDLKNRFKDVSKELLSDEVANTVIRVAQRGPPKPYKYPHDTTKDDFSYKYMSPSWWTSGFFPGSLWLLYERSLKAPQTLSSDDILELALEWQKGMESQQHNTGTHDLGFMMMPAFYSDYKLRGSEHSRDIVVTSAHTLSSRWSETVQCIRSWDGMTSPRWDFSDKSENFLVIIDNMMNLDLLYRGTQLTGDPELARRATQHAKTTLKHHIRPDGSTYHLVNYDPKDGHVQGRHTVQGYSDNSTWSRGQSWGLNGYTTAYRFTRDPEFLTAAIKLAKYFVKRVEETDDDTGVVWWDFDAPRPPNVRDESAAMIACAGMLELYDLTGDKQFLPAVAKMLEYAVENAKAPKGSDTVLRGATANNNPDNKNPNFETGLVYADYYFLQIGNKLMELGLA